MKAIKKTTFEKFIEKYPAYANVPYIATRGQTLSLRDVSESPNFPILLGKFKESNEDSLGALTEAYYERLSRLQPEVRIHTVQGLELSYEDALSHIQDKDEIGTWLMRAHKGLLNQINKRLKEEGI